MGNLFTRAFSGILMLALVLFVSLKGGLILLLSTILLSSISAIEFARALKKIGINYPVKVQIFLGLLLNISTYKATSYISMTILSLVIIFSLIYIALGNKYNLKDMLGFIFAFFYCNFLFNYFILFENFYHRLLVFICSWGSDTFAYIFGLLLGKNKLIEKLSPNKTIEGALGGIIGSTLLMFVFSKLTGIENSITWILLAGLLSILSQIGDLCASYIKRITGIKDFGNIILGHGGILDRFDSVLFVLPIAYFFINFLGGLGWIL